MAKKKQSKSKSRSATKKPRFPGSLGKSRSDSLLPRCRFTSDVSSLRDDFPSLDDTSFVFEEDVDQQISRSEDLSQASDSHSRVIESGNHFSGPSPFVIAHSVPSSSDAGVSLSESPPSSTADLQQPSNGDSSSSVFAQSIDGMVSHSNIGDSLFQHNVSPILANEIVHIPNLISQKGINFWSLSLVGYFVGGKKSFQYVKFWAEKIWGSKLDRIYVRGNGLYYFNFKNEEDLLLTLNYNHVFFGKSLMLYQRWYPGLDVPKTNPTFVPVWVNFYNVPLALWHNDGFAFLASHFGKPICLDDFTKYGHKLSFARICIEVDVHTSIPSSFKIQVDNYFTHEIHVEIPWQPPKCKFCKCFGHSSTNCHSVLGQGSGIRHEKRKLEWRKKVSNCSRTSNSEFDAVLDAGTSASPVSPRQNDTHHPECTPELSAKKRVHSVL